MSTLKPVSRTTLAEQVAIQISDQITAGRWKPGDRLPSEADLCGILHIGRSTLREALKSLAFVGMVQMRPGEGTYVIEESRMLLERIMARGSLKTDKEIQDVGETRLLLEGEIAALAAERAEPEDLVQLETLMGEMTRSLENGGRDYAALDVDFHLAISRCAKNQMLYELLSPIRGVLTEWISKSQELPGMLDSAQSHHKKILDAIRSGNSEKARYAMKHHLRTCEKTFNLLGRLLSKEELTKV